MVGGRKSIQLEDFNDVVVLSMDISDDLKLKKEKVISSIEVTTFGSRLVTIDQLSEILLINSQSTHSDARLGRVTVISFLYWWQRHVIYCI